MITIRRADRNDAELLQKLSSQCKPLDVHTIYTYWVIVSYFKCFILEEDDMPIGFIASIETKDILLIWQIGILKDYRGVGYSYLLLDNLLSDTNKEVHITVDSKNIAILRAIKSCVRKNKYRLEVSDGVKISGSGTSENVVRYIIIKSN